MLLVDIETGFVGVGFVKTERDKGVDDLFNKALIYWVAVPLMLDKAQDGASEFRMPALYMEEKVLFPLHERKLVYKIKFSKYQKGDEMEGIRYKQDRHPFVLRLSHVSPNAY
jgi:hypothetical protein